MGQKNNSPRGAAVTVATPIGPNKLSVKEAAMCFDSGQQTVLRPQGWWFRFIRGSVSDCVSVCLSYYDVQRPTGDRWVNSCQI